MFLFFFASLPEDHPVEWIIIKSISIGLIIFTMGILAFRRWAWLVGAFVYGLFVLLMLPQFAAHASVLLDEVERTRHGLSMAGCVNNILWDVSVFAAYTVLYFVPPVRRRFRIISQIRNGTIQV